MGKVMRMSDRGAENVFARLRWPATDGKPVCPSCGCTTCHDYRRGESQRWRCKACGADFSVTSGTLFAWRKLPLKTYLLAIVAFCNEVKGKSMLALSRDLGVQYKTAFVLAHKLREAMAYVRARPTLWMTLILIFFVSTFGMNFQVTTALMSRGVFHTGAGAFGVASTAFAFGALGGALIAARRGRPTLSLLVATSFAFSVLEVLSGLMPDFLSFLILLVPTGLALLTLTTAANSTMQLGTTAAMRGRVMGLYMLVFLGGTPLGSPLAGWIAEVFGPRMSIISGGIISVIATVVVGLVLARRNGAPARSYLRPAQLARLMS